MRFYCQAMKIMTTYLQYDDDENEQLYETFTPGVTNGTCAGPFNFATNTNMD